MGDEFDFDELLEQQLQKAGKTTETEEKEEEKVEQKEEIQTETTEEDVEQSTDTEAEGETTPDEEEDEDILGLDSAVKKSETTSKETKPQHSAGVEEQKEKKDVFDFTSGDTEFSFNTFSGSDIIEPDVAPPTGSRETILIAGEKNGGKSVAALSFPGKIAVIAFDGKIFAARDFVVRHGIKDENEVMIYYPAKHYNPKAVDDGEIGKAAIAVINDAFRAVYSIKVRADTGQFVPDWVLFDNLEFSIRLAEFAGKYKRGVPITTTPQKGDDVWGAFDIRNIITNVIYKAAVSIPKKGVIYTLYTKDKDVVLPDGTTKKAQVPKWFEVLMYETDNHIIVWKDDSRYFAKIVGTKDEERYPDGLIIETTSVGFWKALNSALKNKGEVELL